MVCGRGRYDGFETKVVFVTFPAITFLFLHHSTPPRPSYSSYLFTMSSSTLRSRTAGSTVRPQHASHASHASEASISSTASSSTLAGRGGSDHVSGTTAVEGGREEASEQKGDTDRREAWTLHAPLPAVKGTFGGISE